MTEEQLRLQLTLGREREQRVPRLRKRDSQFLQSAHEAIAYGLQDTRRVPQFFTELCI